MMKPGVCDKNLCVRSHEQYGLGADVASEIRDTPDVVDLLISFCFAAGTADEKRFTPYLQGVETKYLDQIKLNELCILWMTKIPPKRILLHS